MKNQEGISPPEETSSHDEQLTGGFHTTHWSVVLTAGQSDSPGAAVALERLCRSYWYPLYAYSRRQGQSPADAEDLTQQFFAAFLGRNSFAAADRERGRFRNFLLASFKNFLANEHHRRMTVKRGGRMGFVSLDDTDFEANYRNEAADHASPEQWYDHAWALTLLNKVSKDLRAEYVAAGKGVAFEALQIYLTGEQTGITYERVGAGLGISESAIKMAVMRLRHRYGQLLRREIAQTLSDPSGVEDELRHLVEALSRR
jgi:RNA polymerase sigma-70 factor (ECF subfamily)